MKTVYNLFNHETVQIDEADGCLILTGELIKDFEEYKKGDTVSWEIDPFQMVIKDFDPDTGNAMRQFKFDIVVVK